MQIRGAARRGSFATRTANVLLGDANVPYDRLFDLDEISGPSTTWTRCGSFARTTW
jgi:hypothetical protein